MLGNDLVARPVGGARGTAGPRALLVLLGLALTMLLAACGDGGSGATTTATTTATAPAAGTGEATPAATETPTAIEVTDSSGETITLEGPPARIVSHSPAATEILFAIGAGDRVVAVDDFSNYPPEVLDLPQVKYSSPDPEATLAHEPDLVVFAGRQRDSLEHFRGLGMTVLFVEEPGSIEGVMENIRLFGRVTGHGERAEAVVADMQSRLDVVAAAIADVEEGPTVFYELTDSLYTVSPDSFIGSALSFLKARNVVDASLGTFPQLSSEAVVDANPDILLMADASFVPIESVPERAGWAGITAVQEGRIYPVDGDVMSRPGPRIVDGIESLARLFYPERFP